MNDNLELPCRHHLSFFIDFPALCGSCKIQLSAMPAKTRAKSCESSSLIFPTCSPLEKLA